MSLSPLSLNPDRTRIARLEWWQTGQLPVLTGWAAAVIVVLPVVVALA